MKHRAFAILSLHAKMHQQLDQIELRRQRMVQRIEADEIRAYDNDLEFQKLESLKKEILGIRFVEKM